MSEDESRYSALDEIRVFREIEVKIFGSSTKDAYEKLTGAICDVLSEEAGVDGSCCYVKFEECKLWGYNSFMF